MRRLAFWSIGGLLVLLLAADGVVSYMIATGVTQAERHEQEDHPSNYGLAYEDVEFMSRRGDVLLRGWYISGEPDKPFILFVHGIGNRRSGDRAVDLAARLRERGWGSLLFDLRGHGQSGGEQISGGVFEREDVMGAWDYLVEERGVAPERIGVHGFSMGAGIALLTVADEPDIGALVVDSPYAVAEELIAQETALKTDFPEWLVPVFIPTAKVLSNLIYGIDLDLLVPERAVARIGYPILVIHGTGDTRIPVEHAQRVHAAAPEGSELWLVDGADHVDSFLEHPDAYTERVASYFDDRLPRP